MANAIMDRSYDFEVMSYVIDGNFYASHHAATLVPTAMALCESENSNGKELLTAMLVGDDLAARVQAASDGHPIYLGWDGSEILEKFWHQVDFARTISRPNAERLLELISRIAELDSVHPIIDLMTVKT